MQIGVDLAKSVFEVAVSTAPGRVHERRRLSRAAFGAFFAAHPPAEVLLEACGSAQHWGRELQRLGHTVTLLPPSDVARYRDGNKTDRADAKALLEAARNEQISRVPVKSLEQRAVVALHRLPGLQTRTARINAVRGHLREFGCVIPLGAHHVLPRVVAPSWNLPDRGSCMSISDRVAASDERKLRLLPANVPAQRRAACGASAERVVGRLAGGALRA
jgi:transposase